MRIVDIIPRKICIEIEMSREEAESLRDFFEKCMPLYEKVYSDAAIDDSLSVPSGFKEMLASISKELEERGVE